MIVYPNAIDTEVGEQTIGTVLVVGGAGSQSHTEQHIDISNAIIALETMVGTLTSPDPNSLQAKASSGVFGGDMLMAVFATNGATGVVDAALKLSSFGMIHQFWSGSNQWGQPDYADLTGMQPPPLPHQASHRAIGSDALPLDALGQPTDNVALNASSLAHGLLMKLANTGSKFLRDDGTWQTPAGGGGGTISDAISAATGSEVSLVFDGSSGALSDAVSTATGSEVSLIFSA